MHEHHLHPRLYRAPWRSLRVLLVGAGGTGSEFLIALKNLLLASVAFGNKQFHVTVADGDRVGKSDLARRAFYLPDLGRNKAEVLVERTHLGTGVAWTAILHHVDATRVLAVDQDIVITCVDSREARANVHEAVTLPGSRVCYWLDLGNRLHHGQVVLGSPLNVMNPGRARGCAPRPSCVPEVVNVSLLEDDTPSCSTIKALER